METYQHFESRQIATLVDLIRYRAETSPTHVVYTFLVDGEDQEERLTYAELDRRSRAVGAWLQRHYEPGERAILLFPSGLDYIVSYFGCLYAGIIAVPAYPPDLSRLNRSLPRFLSILRDACPKVVLTHQPILKIIERFLHEIPEASAVEWQAVDIIPEELAKSWEAPAITAESLAFLQYTSGSTSDPKGVMVSHQNLMYNCEMIRQAFEMQTKEVIVSWLPLFHDMGLMASIILPVYTHISGVSMSFLHFVQRPYRWLQAISRYGGTISGCPNFGYELCLRKVTSSQRAELDLTQWRVAFNGAEPVRASTIQKFTDVFAESGFQKEAFLPSYGLAEATVFVSTGVASKHPVLRTFDRQALSRNNLLVQDESSEGQVLVGCGKSWLDERVVVVDLERHIVCPEGQIGEIWVSGPHVTQGYWRNPQATRDVFGAILRDGEDGDSFLRTGDLGFFKGGELYIAGRIKDVVIIDGLNHYPQDIELSMENCHPGIRPGCCAVFSVDVNQKESLVVVAELRRSYYGQKGHIRKAIRQCIAGEHDLSVYDIALIEERTIPKTSSGKIQRLATKNKYLAGALSLIV